LSISNVLVFDVCVTALIVVLLVKRGRG